jgi:hypothetical protein
MRLLFSVNNFGFLRNFEPALSRLAARGHDLHLLAERHDSVGGTRTIENLQRQHPGRVTWSYAPSRKNEVWQPLAVTVRLCLDYWRYLDARYDRAQSLRARAARQAPVFASRLPRIPFVGSRPAMRVWRGLFTAVERAMPAGRVVEGVLLEHRPDLLLLTPLLYFGSQQVEYVRAARALGIRSVLGVGSWDHLTTKGLIHERPDRVVVWNEMQRSEAADLHGITPDRVTVTGAQAYDHWFTQRPATTREAFCARVGVPADRPLLLYLCSSPFITPYEVGFVRSWVAAIRGSADEDLRRAAILVRPHPQNADQWRDVDPFDADLGIWPRAGANPVDVDARADYYDSMFHSAAVVGINTSALIESGIVGRPVFTVLSEDFAGQQDGTLHFQHLKGVNGGGLLQVAATFDEHLSQLAGAIRGPAAAAGRAFIQAFIRPHGLDVPAADRFADVVEAEASSPKPTPAGPSLLVRLQRLILYPVAAVVRAARPRRKAAPRDDKDDRVPGQSRLRILFVLSSPEYLRYFDSTMTLLAQRGHAVSVGVNWLRVRKDARLADLVGDPRIEILGVLPKRGDAWVPFARALRGTMDFVRYLDPRFAGAPLLRARIRRKVLPPILGPLDRIRSLDAPMLARVIRGLQACERAIPVSTRLRSFIQASGADVVVVSPLVDAASDQVDTVRAARALGVRTVAAIASWDNLTNKGLLRVEPDLVTVWNEVQREEAVTLHGLAPERVAVTGAQLFDRWFDREPSASRAEFCRLVGLPADEPFLLFTGSSVFIARSDVEVPFVRRWIEALRASGDERLRRMPILIRPHPFNCDAWATADFTDLGPVAVSPRHRFTPAAESARRSFFDSLYHSVGVVGINTSAMVEAAILRKPVFSVLTPEFAGTQEGTLHFHYLLPEHGGFLRVATSIDAHVAQLRGVLDAPDSVRAQTDQFVERFLRPLGMDVPCTPVLADCITRVALDGAAIPEPDRVGARVLRVCLRPVAVAVKWLHLGEDLPALVRRKIYAIWSSLGRTTRLVIKRLVLRPARLVIWAVGVSIRHTRRVFRTARHRVAVRVRRVIPDARSTDGRG